MIVNDVHSRLNPTRPGKLVRVDSLGALRAAVLDARGSRVSVAGGRHAMGGQQFTLEIRVRRTDEPAPAPVTR